MTTLQNIAAVWVLLAQVAAQDTLLPLFAFVSPEAAQKWQAVNDNVMGGVSDGRFKITADKTMEFSGRLSLENNGALRRFEPSPQTSRSRPGTLSSSA
jgi:hypothetical protein